MVSRLIQGLVHEHHPQQAFPCVLPLHTHTATHTLCCSVLPSQALRRVYGDKVADPVAVTTTKWASEEFTRGSYSYVAVGCSGKQYDTLALPVSRCVLFAGEHTCKEHPDSVGGE